MIQKYQQPEQVDSMMQIEKDLDATKGILLKSIDQLLVRGERLEDLAAKSNDLSFQSKAFMQKSKDLNSCCVIL
jgi:synaptobrevin family protein YKT6